MGIGAWDTTEKMNRWRKTQELYGLTLAQIKQVREELVKLQHGICAACPEPFGDKLVALDHDHHTGAIRGAVHAYCNRWRVAKNNAKTAEMVRAYLRNAEVENFYGEGNVSTAIDTVKKLKEVDKA